MRQKLDAASISTCLADPSNSGCHLIWDMPSFFSLMLVIVCNILNFGLLLNDEYRRILFFLAPSCPLNKNDRITNISYAPAV